MLKRNNNVRDLVITQVGNVKKALLALESFLRAEATPDTVPETLRSLMVAVCDAERDADISLRAMIEALNNGRYLPSTREDIITVATKCDKVANKAESLAKDIVFRHFRFPEAYTADLLEIMAITLEQFGVLENTIDTLFTKMGELIKDHSILGQIRRLESKVDAIEDKMHEAIFNTEMSLPEKMHTSHMLEQLCDLSDIIEDIADKIQIMLIARKV